MNEPRDPGFAVGVPRASMGGRQRSPVLRAGALAGCYFLLASVVQCAVGPDFRAPDAEAPARWNEKAQSATGPEVELARWWEHLRDPRLNQLLELAVKYNPSLAEAHERLVAARARAGISEAAFLPKVDATASARTSSSRDTYAKRESAADLLSKDAREVLEDELSRREARAVQSSKLYRAGLDASWELDVFGRVRRSVEAARADLGAAGEDHADVLTSLLAEVALNYVQVLTFQERVRIAEENLKRQREAAQLVEWRHQAGLAGQLELEQARLNVQLTVASLPVLRQGVETSVHSLSVLTGRPIGELQMLFTPGEASPPSGLLTPSARIVWGVPADTLRRRPDVRRAERNLHAATARIGVAKADRYPTFSIPGSIGLEALTADEFRSGNVRQASIGLGFRWSLFDGGAIARNIEVQTSLQRQALLRYRAAVLSALREVESGMVTYRFQEERRRELERAETSARTAAELSVKEYEAGLVDFETVLAAQQRLLSVQNDLASARADLVITLIRLYKALGGGWKPPERSG